MASPPDWDCDRVLGPNPHAGTIEFPDDGAARIIVRGLHRSRSGEPAPIDIERIVQIAGD